MNDYAAAAEVLCFVLAAIGGLLAYLWRRSESARDKMIEAHGDAISDLEKSLGASDKRHSDELSAYKLHVAEHYVTTNELTKAIESLNDTIKAIFVRFDRLDSKLDSKADK